MDWCDVCKYNPPNYLSHEPNKPCGDCWVYGEGNEPTKFVETENRQTNADKIRHLSDEELAEFLAVCDASRVCIRSDTEGVMVEKYRWLDWLKQEVESDGCT